MVSILIENDVEIKLVLLKFRQAIRIPDKFHEKKTLQTLLDKKKKMVDV